MTSTLAWVVGGGGLLGSHVVKAMPVHAPGWKAWRPAQEIAWREPERAGQQLEAAAAQFISDAASCGTGWAMLWCAGRGTVGTPQADLEIETRYLELTLAALERAAHGFPGRILFASSAGGVYGASADHPLTELSDCKPISDYGRSKLRQENLLLERSRTKAGHSVLVARISNLYGAGQDMDKAQGLIAHISRSLIHRRPVHIYVPLDTLRDYLFVEDCAAHLLRCIERLGTGGSESKIKIFSAGETTTISGVLAAFTRIAKGHPRIISSASRAKLLQPLHLQFRSVVWMDSPAPVRTPLSVGIQRTHDHHLALFQAGRLPPPL